MKCIVGSPQLDWNVCFINYVKSCYSTATKVKWWRVYVVVFICAFFTVFWNICLKSHEILPRRHQGITSLNKSSWSAQILLWLWNGLIETSEPPQLISDEFHISLSELFFWFVGCCVGNNYLVLLCFVSECLQMFVLLCHLVVIISDKQSSLFCNGWWL